MDIDLQDMPSD